MSTPSLVERVRVLGDTSGRDGPTLVFPKVFDEKSKETIHGRRKRS